MEEKESLLNQELFCPKCGNMPEFLNIHTINSKIELKCKSCGVYEILIDKYYEELKDSRYSKIKCINCNTNYKINKDDKTIDNLNYCYECKDNFCQKCENYHSEKHHHFIKFNEKKYYCLKHFDEKLKYFCFDDQENICEQEYTSLHKDHNIKEISELNYLVKKNTKEIEKTNKELGTIIRINNLILKTGEVSNNNYFHLKSIINLGKSFEQRDKIDSKDIRCRFKDLSGDIQISEEAIKAFQKKNKEKKIPLSRKDKNLYLNGKQLDAQDLRYISQVRFNQLKEIDISENEIKSIEPFNNMSLPFLEFLNLSHNKIKDIKPISKLKCKQIQYIFLQDNEIEDLGAILETEFSDLKFLRVEHNKIIFKNEEEKIITKNYEIIYTSIKDQIKEFKEKYNLEIYEMKEDDSNKNLKDNPDEQKSKKFVLTKKDNNNNKIKSKNEGDFENIYKIDLDDLKGGDYMLKKLFLIITYKSENRINELILRNNGIRDPLLLSRIHFNKLEILDLSVNLIKDLAFLSDLKAESLNYLFLDHNNFNDIYPIYNAKLPNLTLVTINNNPIASEDEKLIPGYKDLKEKKRNTGNELLIQYKGPNKNRINS